MSHSDDDHPITLEELAQLSPEEREFYSELSPTPPPQDEQLSELSGDFIASEGTPSVHSDSQSPSEPPPSQDLAASQAVAGEVNSGGLRRSTRRRVPAVDRNAQWRLQLQELLAQHPYRGVGEEDILSDESDRSDDSDSAGSVASFIEEDGDDDSPTPAGRRGTVRNRADWSGEEDLEEDDDSDSLYKPSAEDEEESLSSYQESESDQ